MLITARCLWTRHKKAMYLQGLFRIASKTGIAPNLLKLRVNNKYRAFDILFYSAQQL